MANTNAARNSCGDSCEGQSLMDPTRDVVTLYWLEKIQRNSPLSRQGRGVLGQPTDRSDQFQDTATCPEQIQVSTDVTAHMSGLLWHLRCSRHSASVFITSVRRSRRVTLYTLREDAASKTTQTEPDRSQSRLLRGLVHMLLLESAVLRQLERLIFSTEIYAWRHHRSQIFMSERLWRQILDGRLMFVGTAEDFLYFSLVH